MMTKAVELLRRVAVLWTLAIALGLASAAAQPAPAPPPAPPPADPDGPKPIGGKCEDGFKLSGLDRCVPIRKHTACPTGKESGPDTAGHCCWIGQSWHKGRCIGDPTECPSGYEIDAPGQQCRLQGCAAGLVRAKNGVDCEPCPDDKVVNSAGTKCELRRCEGGLVRAQDKVHCCWPEQVWNLGRGRCVGTPRCPSRYQPDGTSQGCTPAACAAGQIRASDGVSCVGCRPGLQPDASKQRCEPSPCSAGLVRTVDGVSCAACPAGYQPDAGQRACVLSPCAAGLRRARDGVSCVTPGRVRIEANPPAQLRGADGSAVGTTPWEGDLVPGHYTFVLSAAGYDDATVPVDVGPGSRQLVATNLTVAAPTTGHVEIWANRPATLTAGPDVHRAAATIHALELPPGHYVFTLSANDGPTVGYRDATVSVDVVAGQTVREQVTLEEVEQVIDHELDDHGDRGRIVPEVVTAPLDPRVLAAASGYRSALDARDAVGHARVRRALWLTTLGLCVAGSITAIAVSGTDDIGGVLLAMGGAGAGGFCFSRVIFDAKDHSGLAYREQDADRTLSAARAELLTAIAAHRGGHRGSLLARRPPPRFGGGLSVSDGLVVGASTEHAGVAVELGVLVNLGWLHPELAVEVNPGAEQLVARPGLRVSLGRWFFLRGGMELAVVGGGDDWATLGGLGVRLPLARTVSWQLAADYSRTLAGDGSEPVSTILVRTGFGYGF